MSKPPTAAPDEQPADKNPVPSRQPAPHAGRVGSSGVRAERPAETKRKSPAELQPGRGGKAPSAGEAAGGSDEAP